MSAHLRSIREIVDARCEGLTTAALVSDEGTLSWSEVLRHVSLLRSELALLNISAAESGDGILLIPDRSVECILLLWTCLCSGIPVALVHEKLTSAEHEALRNRLSVLAEEELASETILRKIRCHADADTDEPQGNPLVRTDTRTQMQAWRWRCAPLRRHVREISVIVFTSGSTGSPKAVVLEEASLVAAALASEKRLEWKEHDRWLLSMSPAHVGGLSILLRCLLAQKCVVLSDSAHFSAEVLAEVCQRHRVTILSLVPTMLRRCLMSQQPAPPPGVRLVLLGGASASPSLVEQSWRLGWPVLPTYGMSEVCAQIATLDPTLVPSPGSVLEGSARAVGCGLPLDGYQVRSVDGCLQVRSPSLCSGYWVATGEGGRLDPVQDSEGFFSTGDLGFVDDLGRVHVEGRRSDRIVSGGENVSPAEVEQWLESVAGIASACVFGEEDDEWGERVVAAVVLKPELDPARLLTTVEEQLRERLAGFKRPRRYYIVTQLQMTSIGKLDRIASARIAKRDGKIIGR